MVKGNNEKVRADKMGKCEAGSSIPYVKITICGNCYHKDVCDTKDYLVENQCYDFADAQTVIKLPCAIGDHLHQTRSCFSNLKEPKELEVEGFSIWRKEPIRIICCGGIRIHAEKIGKTVFLSKEEAERELKYHEHVLKELGGKQNDTK